MVQFGDGITAIGEQLAVASELAQGSFFHPLPRLCGGVGRVRGILPLAGPIPPHPPPSPPQGGGGGGKRGPAPERTAALPFFPRRPPLPPHRPTSSPWRTRNFGVQKMT